MEFLNNISQATLTVIFVETCIATRLQGWLNEMEQTSPWGSPLTRLLDKTSLKQKATNVEEVRACVRTTEWEGTLKGHLV